MTYFKKIFFCLIIIAGCSNSESTKVIKSVQTSESIINNIPIESNTGNKQLDTLINNLFSALKNSSEDEYKKIIPTEEEIQSVYLRLASKDKIEEIKKRIKEENMVKKQRTIMLELFQLSIKRGKEQKIDWQNIRFTSATIDSSSEAGIKIYNGQISFSESNREFHIKFSDCLFAEKRLVITNVATPYEDYTDDNLAKHMKYKESYMRRCVARVKQYPGMILIPKMSPEEYCKCSFNTIAKQTYGEDNLKDTTQLHLQPGNCK